MTARAWQQSTHRVRHDRAAAGATAIAAGADGSLRPAVEDLWGAGAGFGADVAVAAEVDQGTAVPVLDGAFFVPA